MEPLFLFFVVVLFILAISDLVVGVSNDAVNFLNSALGSKAFPMWAIMIIASLGIVFGATFSSGMMEVARKGIFHPDQFFFNEIMIIFVAVMLTDILLLDLFNTLSLPTSTTVSIVFELLGASVAIAIIKLGADGNEAATLATYINSDKALAIIAGILLSIIVAFTLGALIQYITRVVFSFRIANSYKKFAALWGATAITAIVYFILIKGAKGSSIVDDTTLAWIKSHTLEILGVSFIAWFVILQVITLITRWNILRLVILVGTFALAMAFAGNDLVNFIGVPLAGLKSYNTWIEAGGGAPDGMTMQILKQEVQTPTPYLILAGIIMVTTLWLSKKARSVTQTEINLSRQDEGYERFGSTAASRSIVRFFVMMSQFFDRYTPAPIQRRIAKRFEKVESNLPAKDRPAYDMIRASVNLTVASIVISFATSLKLPLSTTYVTFMVAMGSSLADGAWGRESAVYRVTGVISVIGGWFFTAIIAFTAALIFASLIHWGGIYVVVALLALAIFIIFRTYAIHRKRTAQEDRVQYADYEGEIDEGKVFDHCNTQVIQSLESVRKIFKDSLTGLTEEDRKSMKASLEEIRSMRQDISQERNNVQATIRKLQANDVDSGIYFVQGLDYLKEIANSITHIVKPSYFHIINNHKGLSERQARELLTVGADVRKFCKSAVEVLKEHRYSEIEVIQDEYHALSEKLFEIRKSQLKRIKKQKDSSTKANLLYLDILTEIKTLLLHTLNVLKSQRDFVLLSEKSIVEYY